MGDRANQLRRWCDNPSPEWIVLLEILDVQEEILAELQSQGSDEEDEAGPASLSDR